MAAERNLKRQSSGIFLNEEYQLIKLVINVKFHRIAPLTLLYNPLVKKRFHSKKICCGGDILHRRQSPIIE
jgi:hypothetical protein